MRFDRPAQSASDGPTIDATGNARRNLAWSRRDLARGATSGGGGGGNPQRGIGCRAVRWTVPGGGGYSLFRGWYYY